MTSDLVIPAVHPGDLVLILHPKRCPLLFCSDGRIAQLDDIGYPPERSVRIGPFTFKGIEAGIYTKAPREGTDQHCTFDYKEGIKLFKNELITAGHYKELLQVFTPGEDLDRWKQVLVSSPGIALGYDSAQGVLELGGIVEEAFRFRGQDYTFTIPAVQNKTFSPNDGVYAFHKDNILKILVGPEAIRQELENSKYALFLQTGIIP